jgi:hypothetical protein
MVTRLPTIAARALQARHQRSSPGVSCSLLRFDLPLRREDLLKCWIGRPFSNELQKLPRFGRPTVAV